ncbi:MAG: DUF4326 domain-containing protein [Sphingomonas oligoaromativorans]
MVPRQGSGTAGHRPRRLGPYQRGRAVFVDRPSIYANIFDREGIGRRRGVILFRSALAGELTPYILRCAHFAEAEIWAVFRWLHRIWRHLPKLRGQDVRCTCAANSLWCHGDVLLNFANRRI